MLLCLFKALDRCRESPPTKWPAAAYVLLGREDLALLCSTDPSKIVEQERRTNLNLISMSTPYVLHLHPVTIPSSVSETLELESTKLKDLDSFDESVTDGMEHIFNSSIQLRYGRDMRLNEVHFTLMNLSTSKNHHINCFLLKFYFESQ